MTQQSDTLELRFNLHEKQLEVFKSKARFRVLMAGRRFGKTFLARLELIAAVLQDTDDKGRSLKNTVVWYVAPSYGLAKEIMWEQLKDAMKPVMKNSSEKELWIEAINGRRIYIKGADKPDSLRGRGVSHMVIDEVDSMKKNLWDLVLRPTLADVQGKALFIGTPAPGGELYDFWQKGQDPNETEWESWRFGTIDNPFIAKEEIESAKKTMSSAAFAQEMEADPNASAGSALDLSHVRYAPKPPMMGIRVIAVDLAGFSDQNELMTKGKASEKPDETAIACVEVTKEGWWVYKIIHGRWGVQETALRIIQAAQDFRPVAVGIEQGALRLAVMPYLTDLMKKYGVFPQLVELKHGGQNKINRIMWALQGRFEHDAIIFNSEEDWKDFMQQARVFPHPFSHDDMLDALAYIDQMATVSHVTLEMFEHDNFEPIDDVAGY